jgi:hypothetical protein
MQYAITSVLLFSRFGYCFSVEIEIQQVLHSLSAMSFCCSFSLHRNGHSRCTRCLESVSGSPLTTNSACVSEPPLLLRCRGIAPDSRRSHCFWLLAQRSLTCFKACLAPVALFVPAKPSSPSRSIPFSHYPRPLRFSQ